jgi:DNA modification methylase
MDVLKEIPDNSMDSVVTDPPYEYGFMNRGWDKTGIAYDVDMWKEVFRVLKPGGYLCSFGGTRTYHRMACAIEDAGFTIHPLIGWIFGSGFPKSTNLSKQFDKQAGAERKIVGKKERNTGSSRFNLFRHGKYKYEYMDDAYITEPATPEAKQWDGWYYGLQSLKPAIEPVCMAQKPISEKRMTDNVLKWGVGAVNIDACRVGTDVITSYPSNMSNNNHYAQDEWTKSNPIGEERTYTGRFPANVILDEEAGALLDQQSGISKSRASGYNWEESNNDNPVHVIQNIKSGLHYDDKGGASRFFYCAKASKAERNMGLDGYEAEAADDGRNKPIDNPFLRGKTSRKNTHPTVKPLSLMKYLVRLVTPPGGVVLDPFAGSGSTLLAAEMEGFDSIGIELNPEYCEIARARLSAPMQMAMF